MKNFNFGGKDFHDFSFYYFRRQKPLQKLAKIAKISKVSAPNIWKRFIISPLLKVF